MSDLAVLTIRIPRAIHAELKEAAHHARVSMNLYCAQTLADRVGRKLEDFVPETRVEHLQE